MKNLLISLVFATLAVLAAATPLKELPAEKFRAAGLHKLTDAELAELQAVFDQLKSGEITAIKQEAQQKVAAAEAKAEATAAEQKKSGPSWLRALVTLQNVTEKSGKADPVQSRIAGRFRGWEGNTLFRLENGQIWQHNDDTTYVGVDYDSPAVRIYPGMLGAYWMEVEGVNPRVKVKPVKLD